MKHVCALFVLVFTLVYISTFHLIQVPYTRTYYFTAFQTMCGMFGSRFQVARLHTQTPFSTTHRDFFPDHCGQTVPFTSDHRWWEELYRPVIGDHIHLFYKMVVNKRPVVFHDRNLTETIPYETPAESCTADYAYKKQWYHTGVHSHCDRSASGGGIIHVHPWSAPNQLRVQGREVTLGMFFESVGVERSTMGRGFLVKGKYVKLNMAYFTGPDRVQDLLTHSEEEIMNLWLVDCHGVVLLWDDDSDMPSVTKEDVEFLETFECHPSDYPRR